MKYAPYARILLRYGVGFVLGGGAGVALAADPDVVMLVALGIGAAVEFFYELSKKKGWTT